MTRKDTILIAVVINAGLLAILFTTAVIYDTDKGIEKIELSTPLVDQKPAQKDPRSAMIASVTSYPVDQVDDSLKYQAAPSQPVVVETENLPPEPIAVQANAADEEELTPREKELLAQDNFVEVVVKRGDVLEKIAKANKSTVAAIKKANNLPNEKLSIGQVLKVPVKQNVALAETSVKQPEKNESQEKVVEGSEPVYHVVKSGDNPWKIAKQYNVKYEDILRLNQLDENKARNLKIGDRIRVK